MPKKIIDLILCYNYIMLNLLAWIGTGYKDILCETQLTIGLLLVLVAPFVVGAVFIGFIGIHAKKYFRARKNGDYQSSRKYKKIIIITITSVVGLFAISLISTFLYEHGRNKKVLNADFSIYAPPNHSLDIEYLRQEGGLTVPHVKSRLDTPLGKIEVIQGKFDNEVQDLYQLPDKCDIDGLYEYLGIWGKEDKPQTAIQCKEVATENEWTLLTTAKTDDFGNRAPYAAKLGNTIIVFHAYKSTFGEFSGTPEQAVEYVLKFLSEAIIVDPKTLL